MNFLDDEKWAKWDSSDNNFAKYANVKSKLIYGRLPDKKPDVSIMIPTFRRADLLKQAVDSALAQKTCWTYTVNVLDNDADGDEATDKLMKEYCGKYPNVLYYRHEQNIGMFGNWNRCIELAQADWLCMLHDDDMLKENAIEKMFSIARTERYGIICCACSVLGEQHDKNEALSETGFGPIISRLENMFIKARKGKEIPISKHDIERGIIIGSASHMVRKKSALISGGYDEEYYPSADGVFYQKIIRHANGCLIPEQLYYYRIWKVSNAYLADSFKGIKITSEWVSYAYKQSGKKESKCKKRYYEFAIYYHHMVIRSKEINISDDELQKGFCLPKIYCNKIVKSAVISKYIIKWGMLLFRMN